MGGETDVIEPLYVAARGVLKDQPRLSEAMERAQFRSGLQPGSWLRDRTVSGIATTIPVDLLVPEAVAALAGKPHASATTVIGPVDGFELWRVR